jgi:hypothetical protein
MGAELPPGDSPLDCRRLFRPGGCRHRRAADLLELMHPFHMIGVAGVFAAMHGSLVTSSLVR